MIICCPYCGINLNRPLNDGITHCSNCNHLIEVTKKTRFMSLFKHIKSLSSPNVEKIRFETRCDSDEILFVYAFAVDNNYSNEEFNNLLNKFFDN